MKFSGQVVRWALFGIMFGSWPFWGKCVVILISGVWLRCFLLRLVGAFEFWSFACLWLVVWFDLGFGLLCCFVCVFWMIDLFGLCWFLWFIILVTLVFGLYYCWISVFCWGGSYWCLVLCLVGFNSLLAFWLITMSNCCFNW